jgi:flagellar basal-body rod protein FlgB
MDVQGIPLFSMLQSKLGYLAERQKLIAQNVANASTPGFTPQDLKPFESQPGVDKRANAGVMAQVATTDSGATISGAGRRREEKPQVFQAMDAPDSEATLDGNQVVLEEQMLKMSEARADYDAAIGFYQKAMNMLHMAVHKPGT